MRLAFILLLFYSSISISAQKEMSDLQKLEGYKRIIRQAAYYDSSAVFKNGKKAIKLAQKLENYAAEGKIYQYYGNFYYFSSNDKKAKEYYYKSINFGQKHNLPQLINGSKIRLTFILSLTNDKKAEKDFLDLLKEAIDKKMYENTIEAYNGLGILYENRNNKDIALEYYLKGLKLAEKKNRHYLQGMMLNNIGLIKLSNNQNKEAKEDFEKALIFAKETKEERLVFNLQNNLGIINKKLGRYKKSIGYYEQNYIYAEKLGFPLVKGVTLLNLADSYLNSKMYPEAKVTINSCLEILSNTENYEYLQTAFLIQAKILLVEGKYIDSKNTVDSSLYYQKFYLNANMLAEANHVLAEIAEKQNDFKKAYSYIQKYHSIQDSLTLITNKDEFAQLQILYGKEKDQKELAKQRSKNSLLKKDNEIKQSNLRLAIFLGISFVLLIVGLITLRYSYISKKQQRIFSRKLIENIDIERSRISKDIHDDLGQMLSIIKSKVHMFTSKKADVLQSVEGDLAEVIDLTRNISHSLHPYYISKIGLRRSISSLLEKIQEASTLICSYDIDDKVEIFSQDEKTQIYHIIQECTNNTIKHANALSLKVSIQVFVDSVNLEYRDNGVGLIEGEDIEKGIGLMTIRERAKILDLNSLVTIQNRNGFFLSIKYKKNAGINS